MINKFTLKELEKLGIKYDGSTTHFYFPKKEGFNLEINKQYVVKLSDYMLNPPPNSNLVINWNKGMIPSSQFYKIVINNIISDMIYVTGISYDYDNKRDLDQLFVGWIPTNEMEVMEKINDISSKI